MLTILGYSDGDLEAVRAMLEHPSSAFGLGDAGAHCGAICDASMTTFLLTHWARDRSRGPKLPLARAVRKMTRETAELYGLGDRGVLAPGKKADANVIDFGALRARAAGAGARPAGGRPPPDPARARLRGDDRRAASSRCADGEHDRRAAGPPVRGGSAAMSRRERGAQRAAAPERLVRGRVRAATSPRRDVKRAALLRRGAGAVPRPQRPALRARRLLLPPRARTSPRAGA